MAERATGLTYEDLRRFPDDKLRRELIDGELVVTAAPSTRHQQVVLELGSRLLAYSKTHGGAAHVAPTDVYLSEQDVVEPDVLFVLAGHLERVEEAFVRGAPDLVVEVVSTSPGDLIDKVVKRSLYERHGVPECWYVDTDVQEIAAFRLSGGRYRTPSFLRHGDLLESPLLPGFSVQVNDLFGQPAA